MKIQYDKKIDALYIEFGKGKYSQTRKISDSIMVDEDKKGKVLGVEVLDASENMPDFKINKSNKITFQTI